MLNLECKTLEKVRLLRDIDARGLQLIAFVASRVSYLKGETIFERGAVPDAVYIVLDGEVDLDVALQDGREKTLARFGEGESFGEIGVLNDGARSISVKAHTDACLLKIPKSDFLDLVREMPQLALSVMRDLARRMDGMISRFQTMSCN